MNCHYPDSVQERYNVPFPSAGPYFPCSSSSSKQPERYATGTLQYGGLRPDYHNHHHHHHQQQQQQQDQDVRCKVSQELNQGFSVDHLLDLGIHEIRSRGHHLYSTPETAAYLEGGHAAGGFVFKGDDVVKTEFPRLPGPLGNDDVAKTTFDDRFPAKQQSSKVTSNETKKKSKGIQWRR